MVKKNSINNLQTKQKKRKENNTKRVKGERLQKIAEVTNKPSGEAVTSWKNGIIVQRKQSRGYTPVTVGAIGMEKKNKISQKTKQRKEIEKK